MPTAASRLVARLLWIAPLLLLYLTINQAMVAIDLKETWEQGTPAVAEVLEVETSNRVDVTYDYVSLRVTLDDGRVIEQERLSLPHTMAPLMEDRETLNVRVLPGADQPIVIAELGRAQWRLAAIQAVMAFVGFLLFGAGVFWWNRYLHRRGDPARRAVATME